MGSYTEVLPIFSVVVVGSGGRFLFLFCVCCFYFCFCLFVHLFETVFLFVALAVLPRTHSVHLSDLKIRDQPASASLSARIKGLSHYYLSSGYVLGDCLGWVTCTSLDSIYESVKWPQWAWPPWALDMS